MAHDPHHDRLSAGERVRPDLRRFDFDNRGAGRPPDAGSRVMDARLRRQFRQVVRQRKRVLEAVRRRQLWRRLRPALVLLLVGTILVGAVAIAMTIKPGE
jgi:hypothetical protein